jgi:hypothetical protein
MLSFRARDVALSALSVASKEVCWTRVGLADSFPPRESFILRISMFLVASLAVGAPVAAQEARPAQTVTMSPTELFAFADRARDAGDFKAADTAYRALAANPDLELRTEARFRLALMLADKEGKYREAAVLLRDILDEKPNAARVRLELARMQAQLGDLGAARRELRAAEATGLPPQVERMVRFYSAALTSRRPYGASFEIALAPDSNINRATRSETLGTIIGDFDLSQDARAQSGLGLSTQGQMWGRVDLSKHSDILARLSGSGNFYRKSEFDDDAVSLEVGPELSLGRDRLSLSSVVSWRWFGQKPYTFSWGGNGTLLHALGKRGQLRIDGSLVRSNDKVNDLRDATRYALAAGVDRAFGARFGGGIRLSGQREDARDPGYSTLSGGVSGYLFRELGKTTVVINGGYSHLEADKRLFLYPKRRIDDRVTAGISGTFRSLKVHGFAPIVKVEYERNFSTVELYDYRRIAADIGITAAF